MKFITHNNLKYLRHGDKGVLHIVSAGPSVRLFDLSSLKREAVMTLNNSIYHTIDYLTPKYHVYCEPIEKEIDNYVKMSEVPGRIKRFTVMDYPNWYQVEKFKGIHNLAFEVAIKIGQYMDYNNIYLYGYDFSTLNNYMYWWDKSPHSEEDINRKSGLLNMQHGIFNEFIKDIKDVNIKILSKNGRLINIKDYWLERSR